VISGPLVTRTRVSAREVQQVEGADAVNAIVISPDPHNPARAATVSIRTRTRRWYL
jgi:anthranilate/para-aminobenzoate synthase component II